MAAKDVARGKALERYAGGLFGGRRRRNGEGIGFDDCVTELGGELPLSIEAKAHSVLQLRGDWVAQARRNCGGRPWAIVQRPKGSRSVFFTLDEKSLFDHRFIAALIEAAGFITNQTEEEVDVAREGDLSH